VEQVGPVTGRIADELPPADPSDGPPRQRLAGLDGLRGLAALFVVVNHVFLRAFPGYPVDRAPFWAAWFIYGRFAVVVFIVLSGFSLALAPARHGWRLDGVARFARRRARRILPAYWAALAFSLAVAWLLVPPPGEGAPDARSVLVNGLLVQNLVGAPSPNRAFWSIAVEAQLYVVFPLLLVLVRRWGTTAMVATVTLVVATVGVLGPHVPRLDVFVIQSPPDLAALFAVGILAAGIVAGAGAGAGAGVRRRSWPWSWLALGAVTPVIATISRRGSVWTLDHLLWVDLALGPAVGCLLAGLATGRPAPLLRLLDARPMRNLGLSSYSLYLTHGPIVVVVYELVVAGRVRQGVPSFVVALALVVPLTIVFARLFASAFEIPFRQRPRRSARIRSAMNRTGVPHVLRATTTETETRVQTVHAGPVTGLIAQVLLVAVLAGTVGLSGAGWVVGIGCGVLTNALLARGLARYRADRLGPANRVTLARATLVGGVAALTVDPSARPATVTTLVALTAVALTLDAVDGRVARRTGSVSALGGTFDGEVDAFLMLVLSVYVARTAGAWVLAIGAARYAFGVAGWLVPWMRRTLPPRYWRKVVTAIVGITLALAVSELAPRLLTTVALVVSLALIAESFGRDVWWLWRRRSVELGRVTVSAGRPRLGGEDMQPASRWSEARDG
jgi:peptidoglycan/LPS O-acetylase OafA/YrhL/phosphatidylglycerophosphate synthase